MASTATDSTSAPRGDSASLPAWLERFRGQGLTGLLGLELTASTAARVTAEWTVGEQHLQPLGLVHGGVYASVVETCCSIGAVLAARGSGNIVGMENHTSFLRPVREGRLFAIATPLHVGRRSQLWQCDVNDAAGRRVATGQLRLMRVEPDRSADASEHSDE
jgi:uncharacterized protein (TIGR00369 family)